MSDETKASVFMVLAAIGAITVFVGASWAIAQGVNWMIAHLRIAVV